MSPGRISAAGVAAFIVIATGACAQRSAGTTREGDSPGAAAASNDPLADAIIRVEVNHNRSDGGVSTIYIEPVSGVRRTLGTIGPGERKTFPYQVEAQNRTVKLSAITSSGQTLTSSQMTVPRGAGLVWDLQINSLRLSR